MSEQKPIGRRKKIEIAVYLISWFVLALISHALSGGWAAATGLMSIVSAGISLKLFFDMPIGEKLFVKRILPAITVISIIMTCISHTCDMIAFNFLTTPIAIVSVVSYVVYMIVLFNDWANEGE